MEDNDGDENTNDIEVRHEQSEKDKYLHKDGSHVDHIPDTSHMSEGNQTKRFKRQSDYEYTPTKTRCPLLLVADYRFFQEMGASNTKTTISYLVSFL